MTLEFNPLMYPFHLASLLPILLAIPPALYFYVLVKTSFQVAFRFHWGNGVLPCTGLVTMAGYFLLPYADRTEMFIRGELPDGLLPAMLAVSTFVLVGV